MHNIYLNLKQGRILINPASLTIDGKHVLDDVSAKLWGYAVLHHYERTLKHGNRPSYGAKDKMISFREGKITLDEQNIFAVSENENLNALTEKGLIQRRKTGNGKIYYYFEAVDDGMKFGVFIRLRDTRIEWLRLHWLDSSMKGWQDVSEKALTDEYRLLSNFVEQQVGRPPDKKKNRQRTWRFTWGNVEVSYEPRAFQADIFVVPN